MKSMTPLAQSRKHPRAARWLRALVGILVLGILVPGLVPVAPRSAAAQPGSRETPETLLRRADLVRNPYLGTAVDLELSVVSKETGRELRHARFVMLTHRQNRTLLLLQQEDRTAPGALLIADLEYHLLLPPAQTPVELPLRHVVAGDLSHAGFLRVNLWARYVPELVGEEVLDGVSCWRLDLEPRSGGGTEGLPFGPVRYWIARDGFLPMRIELLPRGAGTDAEPLKTVRFLSYQDTGLGRRPERIEIEDAGRPDERAFLVLGEPTGAPTSGLDFDLDDLWALRAAARTLAVDNEGPLTGTRLVRALREARRDRRKNLGAGRP